jgi:hypothetical protein
VSTPAQLINKMRSWLAETDGKPGVTHVLAFPAEDVRTLLACIDGKQSVSSPEVSGWCPIHMRMEDAEQSAMCDAELNAELNAEQGSKP